MKLLGVALALALLQIVTCRNIPSISYITREQIKRIGSSVEFQCTVQHASDLPVLWVQKREGFGDISSPTGETLIPQNSRFDVRYDKSTSTYVLQINDIQETNAGTYQCQIFITDDKIITADAELRVLRPPVISDNSTNLIVAKEGQSVQLECYADGYPSPNISWTREDNVLLSTRESIYYGNTFKIESIKKEDSGLYYCVAENEVGQKSKILNVLVLFAPKITAVRPRLGQALQYAIDLKCYAEASPRSLITWIKDKVQLSNNDDYSISNLLYNTTLRVNTVEKKHYGYYICKASNELGSSEAKIELFETIIPVCPPACGPIQDKIDVPQKTAHRVISLDPEFEVENEEIPKINAIDASRNQEEEEEFEETSYLIERMGKQLIETLGKLNQRIKKINKDNREKDKKIEGLQKKFEENKRMWERWGRKPHLGFPRF